MLLNEFMRKHKVKEKVLNLKNNATVPLTKDLINEYEKLDSLRVQGMKHAEKKCRKLRIGQIPRTPELSKIRKEIVLWTILIRQKEEKKLTRKRL